MKIDMEARNRKFQAMTPEQKRVAVATDVIRYIAAERLMVKTGSYVLIENGAAAWHGLDLAVTLHEKAAPPCKVCAIGGMFMGVVGWMDSYAIEAEFDRVNLRDGPIVEYLEGIFSREQLRLMEVAFEQWHPENDDIELDESLADVDTEAAFAFGDAIERDQDRLIAICENIIANNGTFDPTKTAVTP